MERELYPDMPRIIFCPRCKARIKRDSVWREGDTWPPILNAMFKCSRCGYQHKKYRIVYIITEEIPDDEGDETDE
jgi:DNA-directed RNA polymerase subunit M/transcription elongation factor TFIIS